MSPLDGLLFSTAGDVQLFFVEPVEVTLRNSLSVMKTKGEWELVNMLAEKPLILPEELNKTFDTLIYHVCTLLNLLHLLYKISLNRLNYSVIYLYIFTNQVVLSRRPTMYVVNLLIPSCFLIALDLFSFLLPPQNVDRSAFKMTLILGYTVFLLLMNDLLPVTGNTLPLISLYKSFVVALDSVLTSHLTSCLQ